MGCTKIGVGQIWPMVQGLPTLPLRLKLLTLALGHMNMFYPSSVIAYNIRVLKPRQHLHFP